MLDEEQTVEHKIVQNDIVECSSFLAILLSFFFSKVWKGSLEKTS